MSLLNNKKQFNLFDKEHHQKKKMDRPVLLHSLASLHNEDHCDNCHRTATTLLEMKMDHIYEKHQLTLWIVTEPQSTTMVDGTIYMVVRDQFNFHTRLSKLSFVL